MFELLNFYVLIKCGCAWPAAQQEHSATELQLVCAQKRYEMNNNILILNILNVQLTKYTVNICISHLY